MTSSIKNATDGTLFNEDKVIVKLPNQKADLMLSLIAILRVCRPRETEANDLLAEARVRIGHIGFTVIALVFVLITFWQR